jgi:hypothetical protein
MSVLEPISFVVAVDAPRIRARSTPAFAASYAEAAQYVRAKWSQFLPFYGTSYQWT